MAILFALSTVWAVGVNIFVLWDMLRKRQTFGESARAELELVDRERRACDQEAINDARKEELDKRQRAIETLEALVLEARSEELEARRRVTAKLHASMTEEGPCSPRRVNGRVRALLQDASSALRSGSERADLLAKMHSRLRDWRAELEGGSTAPPLELTENAKQAAAFYDEGKETDRIARLMASIPRDLLAKARTTEITDGAAEDGEEEGAVLILCSEREVNEARRLVKAVVDVCRRHPSFTSHDELAARIHAIDAKAPVFAHEPTTPEPN